MKELCIAIDGLKKGKSADSKGIKAENLKGDDEETTKMMHEIFNLIINQNCMTPTSWKRVRVTVIFKKGTRRNQKIIDRTVHSHNLQAYLHHDIQQASRQTRSMPVHRPGRIQKTFQTTDHLMTYRLIALKSRECWWQRSTSRRHSIQYNMTQFADLSDTILSVSKTFAFWKIVQ